MTSHERSTIETTLIKLKDMADITRTMPLGNSRIEIVEIGYATKSGNGHFFMYDLSCEEPFRENASALEIASMLATGSYRVDLLTIDGETIS